MASSGRYERADFLARSISEPDKQAKAFARLAEAHQKAGDPARARQALATALHIGPWQQALNALSSVAPDALATIGGLLADQNPGKVPPGQLDNPCLP